MKTEETGSTNTPDLRDKNFYYRVLTPREREVYDLAIRGLPGPEMARALGVTVKGVKYHLTNIYKKCNVNGKHELMYRHYAGPPVESGRLPQGNPGD